jgi:hypothetical protein
MDAQTTTAAAATETAGKCSQEALAFRRRRLDCCWLCCRDIFFVLCRHYTHYIVLKVEGTFFEDELFKHPLIKFERFNNGIMEELKKEFELVRFFRVWRKEKQFLKC